MLQLASFPGHFSCCCLLYLFSLDAIPLKRKRLAFDLWGETVTLANEMEAGGIPERVHISDETYLRVKDATGGWLGQVA